MKRPIGKLLIFSLLAVPLTAARSQTVVNAGSLAIIHGPDELDLAGEMVYAVNFSIDDIPFQVGNVPFIPDTRPPAGASFVIPNSVAPWGTRPDFGVTPEGEGLAHVFEDIRWSTGPVEAHLPVIPGETYKLQVLFYENKGPYTRTWDISVEGTVSVDQVTSLGEAPDGTPPDYDPGAGVVFTQQFTAGDAMLDVIMGQLRGDTPGNDINPIWQGLTLERIRPDTDSDGLPDAWETAAFGNLSQNGAGDPDSDGLSNALELNLGTNPSAADTDGDTLKDGDEFNTLGTDPKAADTDGDGLSDGVEINTRNTNPLAKDTDLDGLTDGEEVNTLGSNPLLTDSDSDDYPDGIEVASGTNPALATSFPLISSFGRALTGAEAGAGLDLTGTFVYAFNVGPNGAPGLIRGVDFTDETNNGLGGITISPSSSIAQFGDYPQIGDSDDNIALGNLLWSIRHAGPNGGKITVTMSGLTAGKPYKLQLLFREGCCQRAFDILVDGQRKLDDFAPVMYQDGTSNSTRGAVAVIGFLATGTSVEVALDGANVANPAYGDHNPALNGVTLEALTGADADGDGLDDLWEISNFGNLAQTGTGDFDSDGLTNAQESALFTDPKLKDTDGDGLEDAAEVNTHHTNPKKVDTDGDGLSDSFEIQTSRTLPTSTDSDNDGYNDLTEYLRGTDALNPAAYPLFGVSVGFFTGGDPGEGLDMTGTFLYAFNASSEGAAPGPVQDVNFTSDSDPGITLTAANDAPNWAAVGYGDTANDDNLEFVMKSIRWSGAPNVPTVELTGLTVGKTYKLQLLFAEQTSPMRGFDIELNGTGRLHEFITSAPLGGVGVSSRGAVVTIGFVATQDTLNIALDGNHALSPLISDRNPILNALTLETLTLPDTDGDGLPDAWEMQFFGDLTRSGTADSDSDGATNTAEYTAGTNPALDDSDGDGIKDGAEAAAGTNPFYPDTDLDGLPDSREITAGTDAKTADTDGDGFLDGLEAFTGSDPLSPGSVPAITTEVFTGGDPGEGLDLQGTFPYAVNIGTNSAGGQAGDALFTADSVPGVTLTTINEIPNWQTSNYGESSNDNVLEKVMNSIRWSGSPNTVRVNLAGLEPGQRYKAQLLFSETGANRGFDVCAEGFILVDDFAPGVLQGNTVTQGVVIAFEFIAGDNELNVVLNGPMFPAAVDKNPTISGITLEKMGAVAASASALSLSSLTATGVTFTAAGTAGKVYALDYSPSLTAGTWVEVNDNVLIGAGGTAQVTDSVAGHRTPGKGFWRLRDPALKAQP